MRLISIISIIISLLGSLPVMASGNTGHFTEVDPDSIITELQGIDIVAAKQPARFRENALAGTLVTSASAERLGIHDVKGMSGVAPNFHIPDYGSRITSSIYVRGIGARMDQPAVGMTIDNVGLLNKDAYDFDLVDISSMEMLRGPHSTLFGRNTMTGLINIRTLSPLEYQGWRGGVTVGLNSLFRFNLGWYHKFNDKWAFSAVGYCNRYAGHFKNVYNNQPVDREIGNSLRLKLHWRPSANVNVANTLYSSILRQGGYAYESVQTGQINYNDTCFYRRFLLTDGLSVNARIGDLTLVSVTSVQHINDNMTLDQDFLPLPYFTLTQKKNETSITEDVMLKGKALDGKYSWIAGIYGFWRHLGMKAPVMFKEVGIDRLIVSHRNDANPYYPIAWNESSFPLMSDFEIPSGGAALYHESRYETSGWHFTAGIRLDYERIRMNYYSHCSTSYTIYHNASGQLPTDITSLPKFTDADVDLTEQGKLSRNYLMVLPKISVMREIQGMTASNVYLSIGKGYKAGGFNTQMFSDVLQQKLMYFMGLGGKYDVDDIVSYKPEKSWNFEIGTHLDLLQGAMQLDASIFYIDCRDQQLTRFPEGTTTGRMMTNAGKTRSFGAEVSANWTPLPRLALSASYGYTNARFTDYYDGNTSYKGKRLPYAPSNTLFAEAAYQIPCSISGKYYIDASVNFSGTGDIYWNESNTLKQNFYGLLGLRLRYTSPRWSVELWGKNMTGTHYYTFYFMSMGNEFRQKGNPRQLGITLRAKF